MGSNTSLGKQYLPPCGTNVRKWHFYTQQIESNWFFFFFLNIHQVNMPSLPMCRLGVIPYSVLIPEILYLHISFDKVPDETSMQESSENPLPLFTQINQHETGAMQSWKLEIWTFQTSLISVVYQSGWQPVQDVPRRLAKDGSTSPTTLMGRNGSDDGWMD